jgi:hypothetical protein
LPEKPFKNNPEQEHFDIEAVDGTQNDTDIKTGLFPFEKRNWDDLEGKRNIQDKN